MTIGESEAKAIALLIYKDIIAASQTDANEETRTQTE